MLWLFLIGIFLSIVGVFVEADRHGTLKELIKDLEEDD